MAGPVGHQTKRAPGRGALAAPSPAAEVCSVHEALGGYPPARAMTYEQGAAALRPQTSEVELGAFSDPVAGGDVARALQRAELRRQIGVRMSSATTSLMVACEHHEDRIEAAAAADASVSALLVEILFAGLGPSLNALIANQLVQRLGYAAGKAQTAAETATSTLAAAGRADVLGTIESGVGHGATLNFLGHIRRSFRAYVEGMDGQLVQRSDAELLALYHAFSAEVASDARYITEVGTLVQRFDAQVAPIGTRAGGGYYAVFSDKTIAAYLDGRLALVTVRVPGQARRDNTTFQRWIDPDMKPFALSATRRHHGRVPVL